MKDDSITRRQQEVLDLIEELTAEWGFAPTIRELMGPLKIVTSNGVHVHLLALEKKGFLTWDCNHARTLRVLRPKRRGMPLLTLDLLTDAGV